MSILFFRNFVEKNGLWHLYKDDEKKCLCGESSEGENFSKKFPRVDNKTLCWICHKTAHELAEATI
jgi:hypothetical protein